MCVSHYQINCLLPWKWLVPICCQHIPFLPFSPSLCGGCVEDFHSLGCQLGSEHVGSSRPPCRYPCGNRHAAVPDTKPRRRSGERAPRQEDVPQACHLGQPAGEPWRPPSTLGKFPRLFALVLPVPKAGFPLPSLGTLCPVCLHRVTSTVLLGK